jgi:hypothetical protein
LLLALGQAFSPAQAQIYTLTDENSSAEVNVASQQGMFNWTVDGANYLNTQWFWLALGGGAPTALNNLGLLNPVQTPYGVNGPELVTTYGNSLYNVEVDYLLTGSLPGSGQSDISETISLNNTSSNPLTLHFYQYSDFNFGLGDAVQLGKNSRSKFDLADVTSLSGINLSETVATPGANEGEAGIVPSTLAKLTNGLSPVTLSGAMSAGPGTNDATWAFEWDVTLSPGQTFLISKDKSLDVPEPGCLSLLSLGLGVFAVRRFRRA